MTEREALQVLEEPTLEEAATTVRKAISRRRGLIAVGHCWVEYRGRARSILEPGERIVMVKEDGAILVHRPTGYEPVNWQPPDCYFRTRLGEDFLLVEAVRRRPRESLKVFFDRIYLLAVLRLVDEGEFSLHVSEKEIQEAILSEPSLVEEGFRPVAYEKRVEPGFIDVYGVDAVGRFVVVEIKRVRAGKGAVVQLAKYVENVKSDVNREVRGILVAPEIARGVQKTLATLNLEYRRIDLQRCARVLAEAKEKRINDFFK